MAGTGGDDDELGPVGVAGQGRGEPVEDIIGKPEKVDLGGEEPGDGGGSVHRSATETTELVVVLRGDPVTVLSPGAGEDLELVLDLVAAHDGDGRSASSWCGTPSTA